MNNRHSWRGIYLIGLLAAGLLGADALAPLSTEWHDIVTVGVVFLLFGLTLYWTETHADLVEAEGIDAQARRRWFIAQGERYVLPRTGLEKDHEAGKTRDTERREYAILCGEILNKV